MRKMKTKSKKRQRKYLMGKMKSKKLKKNQR